MTDSEPDERRPKSSKDGPPAHELTPEEEYRLEQLERLSSYGSYEEMRIARAEERDSLRVIRPGSFAGNSKSFYRPELGVPQKLLDRPPTEIERVWDLEPGAPFVPVPRHFFPSKRGPGLVAVHKLTGTQFIVLMEVLFRAKYSKEGSRVSFFDSGIARDLLLDRATVFRAVKALVASRLVWRVKEPFGTCVDIQPLRMLLAKVSGEGTPRPLPSDMQMAWRSVAEMLGVASFIPIPLAAVRTIASLWGRTKSLAPSPTLPRASAMAVIYLLYAYYEKSWRRKRLAGPKIFTVCTERIAAWMGVSQRSAQRALLDLTRHGVTRNVKDGRWKRQHGKRSSATRRWVADVGEILELLKAQDIELRPSFRELLENGGFDPPSVSRDPDGRKPGVSPDAGLSSTQAQFEAVLDELPFVFLYRGRRTREEE